MGVWGELDASWKRELAPELESDYFKELAAFVEAEYAKGVCYPPGRFIFEAFNRTPFDRVKAVIIGQDPYHGPNQAHGLAFSVLAPTPPPPSLLNIYKELEEEYDCSIDHSSGDLSFWADQGVLLLNSTLTVAEHMPGSHQKHGWERFTDAVVSALNARRENIVFMLWGAPAQKKGAKIDKSRHCVLAAPHPSPLSAYRGFFGCGHFRAANAYLEAHGIPAINWLRP
ncbi:MAG: uracil-DNA glycosylase [Kiritimatiellae bacterium]|nr:uracil-DNA glycosylase [Kiritimatiellia bacterium]